ncbi:MAG: AzlC family ABC transporter permease [Clostridia bacterium]|nr:AzlC family ABC transporter permease [Clostridia bacterium]
MKKLIKTVIIKTLPVMTGYIALGIGFGILFESKGYGLLWSLAMAVLIYAGSMQYVAINLITGGASLIVTALTTLMVNARHLFYGISMIDKYKDVGKTKPYLIFALTDETYSLLCGDDYPEAVDRRKYQIAVSLFNHIYWISGCALGSIIGSAINFDTAGIDFCMTALFVTIFLEQWLSTKEHKPALIGLLASTLCLVIFGKDAFLIPSMLLISVLLLIFRKSLERKVQSDE